MANYNVKDGENRCAFCGKTRDIANKLIRSDNGLYICDECIELCVDALKEEKEKDGATNMQLLKPQEIKALYTSQSIGFAIFRFK